VVWRLVTKGTAWFLPSFFVGNTLSFELGKVAGVKETLDRRDKCIEAMPSRGGFFFRGLVVVWYTHWTFGVYLPPSGHAYPRV
jgi:hypothetical protein